MKLGAREENRKTIENKKAPGFQMIYSQHEARREATWGMKG